MQELVFDVAIVGYGPVGAVVANYLGSYGIKTVVLERETDAYHLPRAIGFNHEIMRIFQQLGLDSEISSVVTTVDGVEFLNQSHQVMWSIELSKTCLTHGFSPNYVFYQPDLEAKLRAGVERFDEVMVRLGHDVVKILQDRQTVTVEVRDLAQDTVYQIEAQYVLGCDGARSITRQLAGLKLDDFGFHQRQLVVDALLTEDIDLPTKVQQLCDTRRPGVFVHSTNNHRRWEFVLKEQETKAEMEQPEKVKQLLATYWLDPSKLKIIRAVVYHFHSLIALQWRNDRIFIVGDAAHQMPPILGQGMCSGIRDAQNICWKLDLVLRGLAPDKLLDSYQTERLPHVQEIVKVATRAFKIFKTRNPLIALVRNTILRLVQRWGNPAKLQNIGSDMPPLRQGILQSSAKNKSSAIGQMFIQPQVLTKQGDLVLLDSVLGKGWAIIGLNTHWSNAIAPESAVLQTYLSIKLVCVVSSPISDRFEQDDDRVTAIADPSNQIKDWLAKYQQEIAIIRPDRYVFGTCKITELDSTLAQLKSLVIGDRPLPKPDRLSTAVAPEPLTKASF